MRHFFLLKKSCFIFHIVSEKRLRSHLDTIVSFVVLSGIKHANSTVFT